MRTRSTATGQNSTAAAAAAATVAHVRSSVNCHGQGAASTDANSRRRTPDCDGPHSVNNRTCFLERHARVAGVEGKRS
ncbi:unnamed protein product [Sphagnum jensenii]|uniref:Secreted protein n=1 Tax=Sphagnum jensenii TaxID=128206 RepID=A0ABP0ZZG5_9BRYO